MSAEKQPVDLAKIFGPIRVDAGPLGPISVPIRTAGFLVWFEKGDAAGQWKDGLSFMRQMLRDQARQPTAGDDKAGIEQKLLALVDENGLNLIASAMLNAIGPTLVRSSGNHGQAGLEPEEVPDNSEVQSPSERLLTMVRDYHNHHRRTAATSLATMKQAFGPAHAMRLAEKELSALVAKAHLGRAPLAGSGFEGLASKEFFSHQRQIAEHIAALTAPLGKSLSAIGLADRFRPLISPALASEIAESQLAFANALKWGLGLQFPPDVLAELASAQSATLAAARAAGETLAASRVSRFGFQATANLALQGFVAPGAAAELLQRYGEDSSRHGPAFDAVLDAVRSMDEDHAELAADPQTMAERAWHAVASQLAQRLPHISAEGLIVLVTLLLAIAELYVSCQSLNEQRRPDVPQRLARIEKEVAAMRRDQLAARAADRESDKYIRYVHRTVNLRAEPSRGAMVLRLVYPDQLVRVVDVKGEWAKAEVFEYATEKPLQGWINRRYLRARPAT